jgi:GNAT superfamily N-acetyltransferase
VSDDDVLAHHLEEYYDAVPRTASRTEECGPFTLFVATGPWPSYARPRLGSRGTVSVDQVQAVRTRQRALGVPEQIEWQPAATPSLAEACRGNGMAVQTFPLLVHVATPPSHPVPAVVRRLTASDDVAAALATQQRGFGAGGQVDAASAAFVRDRLARSETVLVVAEVDGLPVSVGMHQPVGPVSEIVGVATLPSHRRRGLGAAVTALLVADAYDRGVRTVFLSAGDDAIARVYRRVGFRDVGASCAATAESR